MQHIIAVANNAILKLSSPHRAFFHSVAFDNSGYLSSQFIVERTAKYKVREKTDRDDLEYANQQITLSLLDFYNSQERTGDATWLVIICSIIALVCGIVGCVSFEESYSDFIYRNSFNGRILFNYILTIINGCGLFYLALHFDHEEWDVGIIVGLLLIVGFFIGVIALWFALIGVTSELLEGSKYCFDVWILDRRFVRFYHYNGNTDECCISDIVHDRSR